jgi:hypothetical protein
LAALVFLILISLLLTLLWQGEAFIVARIALLACWTAVQGWI